MDRIRVEHVDSKEVEQRDITSWGQWEKGPSEFDWEYSSEEQCYIIEGRARVATEDGEVDIEKGDFVVFPVGLKCRWKVEEKIKKYYTFR